MSDDRLIGAFDERGRGCVINEPIPQLRRGTVLVKVHASLISPGSELSRAKTARKAPPADSGTPTPFGYQNAGEVIDLGENVSGLKRGDRVACMGATYALHSNYAIVPQNLCASLPANVSYEEGAFAHLAMTALHTIRRGEPQIGEYLLVVGLGLVGQLTARLGQVAGMYTMGWDTIGFRCDLAKRWGIDQVTLIGADNEAEKAKEFTNGFGFDMAVIAFGGDATETCEQITHVMSQSVDTHLMGRICIVGGATTQLRWGAALGNMDVRSCARTGPGYHDEQWEHGETAYPPTFMRWNTKVNMTCVLRLISEQKLDVKSLITHRLPLAKIDDAITAHVENPDATLGTVLLMGS